MATAAKKAPGTAVVKWDEELAKQAQVAAAMEESAASGQFFSLKSGILSFNDAPMPNNQMGAIITDSVLENVFYEGEYDPETPQGPVCYAFGRDEKQLEPHKKVVEAGNAQHDHCAGCPHNEWGSADKGRGKACRNSRRLALIPAGTFDANNRFKPFDQEEQLAATPQAFMRLPVTSVKGYAAFVKQIASAMKRPPHGIITKISVVPDPSTQFKVKFEPLMEVPKELLGVVMKRHTEAEGIIDFAYPDPEEKPAPKKAVRGKTQPARGRKY